MSYTEQCHPSIIHSRAGNVVGSWVPDLSGAERVKKKKDRAV